MSGYIHLCVLLFVPTVFGLCSKHVFHKEFIQTLFYATFDSDPDSGFPEKSVGTFQQNITEFFLVIVLFF